MSNGRADARLARVASRQAGVFSRGVASRCGLSERQIRYRVANGLWVTLLPGVYRNAATPASNDSMLHAALTWAGPDAALSHRSAGALLGLDEVHDELPELLVPMRRHPRSALVTIHRTDDLDTREIVRVGRLRCTSPIRTVIDLAAVFDEEALEFAVESARRRFRLSVPRIRARLEERSGRGHAGAGQLRALLDYLDGEAPAESVLEVRVARRLRKTTLAEPVRQFRIRSFGHGYRVDFAWPAERVVLECGRSQVPRVPTRSYEVAPPRRGRLACAPGYVG